MTKHIRPRTRGIAALAATVVFAALAVPGAASAADGKAHYRRAES